MLQAKLVAPEKIKLEKVETPPIKEKQVLIKQKLIIYCSVNYIDKF